MKTKFFFLFALVICFSSFIYSQGTGSQGVTDARSMGMAKTFAGSTFGLYAIGKNPANLFQDSSKTIELALPLPIPNIAGSVGTNFMTLEDYNYYFGTKVTNSDGSISGRILTEADKSKLKDLFADGGTIASDVSIQLLSISFRPNKYFGTIAFSISDRISSLITLPQSLISLGLEGNQQNRLYNFDGTEFKAWWLRKYTLTYSRDINPAPKLFKSFSIGISLNLVQGYAYAGLDHINTELTTGNENVITGKGDFLAYSAFSPDLKVHYNFDNTPKQDFSFVPFPSPAGKGTGFDFGLNAKFSESFSIGLSITDIGSIKWDKNVAQFTSNSAIYLDDLSDEAQRDTLINRITGKESGKYIGTITTQMASALHFGFSYKVTNNFLLAGDYNQGLNEQPGNSKKPRFSIGMDWHHLGVFSVRTGFSFGGFEKFNWGLGFGIIFEILEMNFGSPDLQYAFSPQSAKRVTFAIDSKWKF